MIIAKKLAALTNSYYTRFLVGLVLPMILGGMMGFATAQELLPQSDVSNSRSIVIDMESYVFSPSEITVDVGKPITLVLNNQSFLVPHNFLLDDPNGVRVLEAEISSGESQTHTLILTEPGIYLFYCDKQLLFFPTHREEGMEGRLIVR
jgi:plastocyanin